MKKINEVKQRILGVEGGDCQSDWTDKRYCNKRMLRERAGKARTGIIIDPKIHWNEVQGELKGLRRATHAKRKTTKSFSHSLWLFFVSLPLFLFPFNRKNLPPLLLFYSSWLSRISRQKEWSVTGAHSLDNLLCVKLWRWEEKSCLDSLIFLPDRISLILDHRNTFKSSHSKFEDSLKSKLGNQSCFLFQSQLHYSW